VAVADHQPPTTLVALAGELGQVRIHLRLQRRGQHPPRAVTHDLIDQRRAAFTRTIPGHYRKHGRTFPTDAPTSACLRTSLDHREGTPLPPTHRFQALLPCASATSTGVEKIAKLPRPLTVNGAPAGADPDINDIGYYA
jgi:hypothetical protein